MVGFIQYAVSGTLLGAIYALIALGIVIIYKSTRVFNFAQAQFMVWGVLFSYWTIHWLGPSLGLVVALSAGALLGLVMERLTLRPLIGQPLLAALLMTLALGYLLEGLAFMSWGTAVRKYPEVFSTAIWRGRLETFPTGILTLGPVKIGYTQLWSFGGALVLFGLFSAFYHWTRLGKAMRAVADDHQVSQSLGIKVRFIFSLSWAIAALVGFVAAVFVGSLSGAFVQISDLGLRAIPALLIGGLDSIPGALVGGIIVGILESLATGYFGAGMGTVTPYFLLLLFLLVRPYGLFGERRIERL
jgi:branched-chain amino acid transport system permease protein